MMLLNTSLLRERFVIHSLDDDGNDSSSLVAVGNRLPLNMHSLNHEIRENFVVRGHSMHVTLRMAAAITKDFYKNGPIMNRIVKLDWAALWADVIADFEKKYTPETWVAVYHKGRPVFTSGNYHPLLDIIEQCDATNKQEYDRVIPIATDIFKQAGHAVDIDYDVNIAMIIGAMENKVQCGLILRDYNKTSTFKITMTPDENREKGVMPDDGLMICADFLEGIQLSVMTGVVEKKILKWELNEQSDEAKKAQFAYRRIGDLNRHIDSYETVLTIRYRPEKPDFITLKDRIYL